MEQKIRILGHFGSQASTEYFYKVLLRVFFQCFDEQTQKKLIEYKSERKVNFGFKLFCVKMGVLN